jgi:hypothetical protein
MKKILYLIAAVACLSLAGCQFEKDLDIDTYDGKGLEFVHFNSASDAWMVSADDPSYVFNVTVGCSYKYSDDRTYSVSVGPATTGVEGVDFTIPNKSVTIKAGEYTGTVPVTVLYETTGEGFILELLLSVDEKLINSSYGDASTISVKSDKITMDWAWLEGNWIANDWNYYSGGPDGDAYTAAIVKVDETHCLVRNIWGSGADFEATVDFDAQTITVPGNQLAFYYAGYSANFMFVAVNPETDYDVYDDLTTPVVGTFTPAGIVFDNYDFLLSGGPYDGYTYAGGLRTTLTK